MVVDIKLFASMDANLFLTREYPKRNERVIGAGGKGHLIAHSLGCKPLLVIIL